MWASALGAGPAAALAAVVGLAVALRLVGLGDDSLWGDEAYSVYVARLPLTEIPGELARVDTHPPLHYLLLHGWIELAGDSEAAVRGLSVMAGVLTVPVVYLLGAALGGVPAGLLAALFAAVSPHLVRFSQETRMYALLALLAALSYLFLLRLERSRSRRDGAAYAVVAALMLYTHVWGWFVLLAQVVTAAVHVAAERPAGARRRDLLRLAGLVAAVIALVAPWLPSFVRQASEELRESGATLGWLGEPAFSTYTGTFRLILGPPAVLAVAILLAAAAALWLRAGGRPHAATAARALSRLARDPRARLLALWLVVPLAAATAVSFAFQPLVSPRYTIPLAIPVYLALALAVTGIGPGRARLAAGGLVASALLAASAYYLATFTKEPWRTIVAAVESRAAPGDVVVIPGGFYRAAYLYYAARPDLVLLGSDEAEEDGLPPAPRIFVVDWQREGGLPPDVPRGYRAGSATGFDHGLALVEATARP